MKIAILSNGPKNYSTTRLYEEAAKRGHEVDIIKYKIVIYHFPSTSQ